MVLQELKKELVSLIENTSNEELLVLLKEEILYYGNDDRVDVTDGLSMEQLDELKALAEEDAEKDTMSLEEFKAVTQKWRIG